MVAIPKLLKPCPTATAAIQAWSLGKTARDRRRTYLGFSSIGEKCSRKLWYGVFSKNAPIPPGPIGRLAIEDGHRGEDVVAEILRCCPGVELHTCEEDENGNPILGEDGKPQQIRCEDFGGAFAGHLDGEIKGLIQAPKTWHIWENKVSNQKKWKKLRDLMQMHGEKAAVRLWDHVYYAQAVLYMHYRGLTRHYLTCALPGVRAAAGGNETQAITGVRTNEDPIHAGELIRKADRILHASFPPARISDRPDWHECMFCQWRVVCHGFDAWEKKT